MYKLILDLPEQDSDRIAMVFHADRNEVQSLMESFRQTVRTEAERMRAEKMLSVGLEYTYSDFNIIRRFGYMALSIYR